MQDWCHRGGEHCEVEFNTRTTALPFFNLADRDIDDGNCKYAVDDGVQRPCLGRFEHLGVTHAGCTSASAPINMTWCLIDEYQWAYCVDECVIRAPLSNRSVSNTSVSENASYVNVSRLAPAPARFAAATERVQDPHYRTTRTPVTARDVVDTGIERFDSSIVITATVAVVVVVAVLTAMGIVMRVRVNRRRNMTSTRPVTSARVATSTETPPRPIIKPPPSRYRVLRFGANDL